MDYDLLDDLLGLWQSESERRRLRENEAKRRWRERNPQKQYASQKACWAAKPAVYRAIKNRCYRKKYQTDPLFRLERRLRQQLTQALARHTGQKHDSALNLIGCSISALKLHLESLWEPGMTWDTYGQWHIDHIRPVASFDLTDLQQQRECFHWTNLRPLWAEDNLARLRPRLAR